MSDAITRRFTVARRDQRGAALLALTTLVVVVSAGIVLHRLDDLESAVHSALAAKTQTTDALAQAKAAVLFYAASDDSVQRPGELPCPDVDYTVGADNPCTTLRGWLPHTALGSTQIRDASGERLWFALTDGYHKGHSAILNSETQGDLRLDGTADIVAVIIAPMAPLDDNGARPGAADPHDAQTDVGAYLEEGNADGDLTTFLTEAAGSGELNDRIVAVTRAELMAMVEKRVLGEVARALSGYLAGADALPWLTPLQDPATSPFKASLGTRAGHLSFHQVGETFETARFRGRWDLPNADITIEGDSVSNGDMTAGDHNISNGLGATGGPQCLFTDKLQVNCSGYEESTGDCNGESGTLIRRTYDFVFTGEDAVLQKPKTSQFRRRRVRINKPSSPDDIPLGSNITFTITDVALSGPELGNQCGKGTLINDGDTTGFMQVAKIRWELGAGEEIPQWILQQQWHHQLYVAYADPLKPSNSPTDCSAGSTCLSLSGVTPSDDKRAVVVLAGNELAGQNRDTWSVSAYYEEANTSLGDDAFKTADAGATFNDRVRVVTLSP